VRERSLVAFTLLAQMAVGLFWALTGAWWLLGDGAGMGGAIGAEGAGLRGPLLAVGALVGAAALASLLHLGTPRNAWRALGNLRTSWLSREILLLTLFAGGWAVVAGMHRVGAGPASARLGLAAVVSVAGAGLVYSMARVYRIRTVPAWDTWLTTASFFLTTGHLGALAAGLAVRLALGPTPAVQLLALLAAIALAAELWLESGWLARRRMASARVETALHFATAASAAATAAAGDLAVAARATTRILALALTLGVALGVAGEGGHPVMVGLALAAALAAGAAGRVAFYGSYARSGV
jgi:anaerobic dimethyl sulfoxide reductase subunit C